MIDFTMQWARVKASRLGLEGAAKPRARWRWPWVSRRKLEALQNVLERLEKRVEQAEKEAKEARAILAAFSQTYYTTPGRRPRS